MNDAVNFPKAETRYEIAPKVSVKSMGEDEGGVLLKLDSGEMFTVNDTTLAFLGALDGKTTVGNVIDFMLEEFDVERSVLETDLNEIVQELAEQKLIRAV